MMKRIALIAATLLAGACTVGPNYHEPALPVPPAYAGPQPPGAAIDPGHWWTAFGDPELDGLIDRALRDNPDIATAASRVREARLQEIGARADGLPSIDATANITDVKFSKNAGFSTLARQFGGGGTGNGGGIALPGNSIKTFALGFDANWELDLFGGTRRGVEAALARTQAAEWSRRDAAVMLAAEVAQAYFALRLDQQQAAVVADEVARQQRALQIAGHVAQVGLTPRLDVTRQRASISSTSARFEPIRADIQVRMHALGILLGQPPAALNDELKMLPTALPVAPAIPAGLPSDLLRRRPDVRAAERSLAASTGDIGVAVADLYPKFSLTGIAQLISTSLGNLFTGDSLQLTGSGAATFPLLDFGKRKSAVEVRKEQREQAFQAYRMTVLRALRDVEDALSQIDAERRRNSILRGAVADREASARGAQAQYRSGLTAQDSLLNAQIEVLVARENLAASYAQLNQSSAALFKAIGGGWDETTLPTEPKRM